MICSVPPFGTRTLLSPLLVLDCVDYDSNYPDNYFDCDLFVPQHRGTGTVVIGIVGTGTGIVRVIHWLRRHIPGQPGERGGAGGRVCRGASILSQPHQGTTRPCTTHPCTFFRTTRPCTFLPYDTSLYVSSLLRWHTVRYTVLRILDVYPRSAIRIFLYRNPGLGPKRSWSMDSGSRNRIPVSDPH